MKSELIVHYSNKSSHPFRGTQVFNEHNLRRWAIALVKNADIIGATLYVRQPDGTDIAEEY